MIKNLKKLFPYSLLLGSLVLVSGCPLEGGSSSESEDDTATTTADDTTTTTVTYNWLTVTSPNGGETWSQGSTYNITWAKGSGPASGADYVSIKLYKGSGDDGVLIRTIEEDPTEEEKTPVKANDGTYSWVIPVDIPDGSDYEIRVKAKDAEGVVEEDESNVAFTISTGGALSLKTSAFNDGGSIPETYTCDGADTRPTFTISGVPSGAKSLVMFLDDIDGTPTSTTTDNDWNHWVIYDIPVVSSLNPYSLPSGTSEGKNQADDRDYDPICPPGEKGDRKKHTYRFELYALDALLNIGNNKDRDDVVTAMKGKLLEKDSMSAYFGTE
jgi:hypothetical protein